MAWPREEAAEGNYPGFLIEFARWVRKRLITGWICDVGALNPENSLCRDRFATGQSVFSACLAKRANAVRDSRSIRARTALSFRFCLVAAR